jgi:hypothetical protein
MIEINLRKPFPSELKWFSREMTVAGYCAEDEQVVLNPYVDLSRPQLACVLRNEAVRIFMRKLSLRPDIDLHHDQIAAFAGTPYEHDIDALRETIIARVVSRDPSAGKVTEKQLGYACALSAIFDRLVKLTSDEASDSDLLHLATNRGFSSGAEIDPSSNEDRGA